MTKCNKTKYGSMKYPVRISPRRENVLCGAYELPDKSVARHNEREAALLLSLSSIAENEIRSMSKPLRLWSDSDSYLNFPELPNLTKPEDSVCSLKPTPSAFLSLHCASPRGDHGSVSDESKDDTSFIGSLESPRTTDCDFGSHRRFRSVSFDSPQTPPKPSLAEKDKFDLASNSPRQTSNVVSPIITPVVFDRHHSRKAKNRGIPKRERRSRKACVVPPLSLPPTKAEENTKRSLRFAPIPKGKTVKTILRKKFSWKNYPELEAFLISNREEYLRHSALNYTLQQKQYNNRLTERLLQLAAENGYVFDEGEFSFVTVRDRIRCYFKSYVQSAKKRGVIIGYAARKAGLLSSDQLLKSAKKKGIIMG